MKEVIKEWPYEISKESFQRAWQLEGEPLWRSVFEMHREKMQIKNVNIAIVNLEKIFRATFRLANSKGFQAMSLRDLSRETEISMGGLYAYIGSKDDLASVIEGVMRKYIEAVVSGLDAAELEPVHRLKAIIFGGLYMMEIMNPWYYFCFMELKGLPREQQRQAMSLEQKSDGILIDAFLAGQEQGQFTCTQPELLAPQVSASMQQWFLKYWKFKDSGLSTEQFANFVLDSALTCLNYQPSSKSSSTKPELHEIVSS